MSRINSVRTSVWLSWIEVIPFDYSFSNLTILSVSRVSIRFRSTHPTKVVCFTEERSADVEMVSLNETEENRFYIHSNTEKVLFFPIVSRVGEDTRLYCRVTDLGLDSRPSTTFASAPFVTRFSSLKLKYTKRDEESVHFELLPKGLYTILKGEEDAVESGRIRVECTELPLFPVSEETSHAVTATGFLPIGFQVEVFTVSSVHG